MRLVSQSTRSPDWPRTPTQGFKTTIAPAFLNPQKSRQPTLPHKITQKPIIYTLQDTENPKCLIIPATISTLLIIRILLTMCGITVRWLMRSPKFWPGYLHSNLRDATRTFEPAGSRKWETGSYKLRNIGIGLVVSMGLKLIVQLCFATEVRGSVRPTLGKRNHI